MFWIWKNSCTTYALNNEPDIDEIYLYAKDSYEAKLQLLIRKRESKSFKYLNDSKAFIEKANDMDDIYKNIENYDPNKKRKLLIVFNDMIADRLSDTKLHPIVTEFFIWERKLNTPVAFTTQHYFCGLRLFIKCIE